VLSGSRGSDPAHDGPGEHGPGDQGGGDKGSRGDGSGDQGKGDQGQGGQGGGQGQGNGDQGQGGSQGQGNGDQGRGGGQGNGGSGNGSQGGGSGNGDQGSGGKGSGGQGSGGQGSDQSGGARQGQQGQGQQGSGTQDTRQDAAPDGPPAAGTADCGPDTSAATKYNWGTPTRVDNFDGTTLDSSWGVYNGPGHNGAGRRTPDAISVKDGIMTMTGDAQGNSGGMAWQPGQRYGRWEGRVRSPAGDPNYHAVMLLWPDAENWPVGGEVDFMEISDPSRQNTQMFLHYGQDNQQVQGSVDIDATQWHDWAVEWTPTGVTAYVDGKEWWSTKQVDILPPGPMHLCIQLDNFSGGNMKKTTMEVDWVKEYKLSPADAAKGAVGDAGKAAEGALDTAGRAAGGLAEGAADATGKAIQGATRPLTEGAPDPVPAVSGLVPNAVPAPLG
jgi:hypothetical protein